MCARSLPVAGVLAQAVPQVEPPPALRDRVLSQVGPDGSPSGRPEQRRSRVGFAGSLPVPAMAERAGCRGLSCRGRGVRRSTRSSCAAASTRSKRVSQDALARAQASESQLADTRRVMGEAQSQLAVLTAPDVMRVDLAGQSVAPSAAARAFWSRSRGLVLAASNLPALPPGRTYQLWFVTGKAPSSAGIFEPDAAGAANVLLTVDPNAPRPSVLAVRSSLPAASPRRPVALYSRGSVQRSDC